MSRRIWFRGIKYGTNVWTFGLPSCLVDGIPTAIESRTKDDRICIQRIDPKTLCQKILVVDFDCFEKDIVRTPRGIGLVEWNQMDGRYEIVLQNGESYCFNSAFNDLLEVIGNLYENPELLEEQHEPTGD